MGHNESCQEPPVLDDLIFTKDHRYGGSIRVDSFSQKAYRIFFIDEMSHPSFIQLISKRQDLRHSNFVTVRRYWINAVREPCSLSNRYQVTIEYQFYNRSLETRIKEYCQQRMPFPQSQLRNTFYQIVSCLNYLKNGGTCHGDIKPENILFDSQGKAFLLDSYFIKNGRMAFEIVMEDPESMSLLSPQQLENLRNKKFASLETIYSDEMFAIGLSMLEAMTAEPAMECYDLKNLRIKNGYFTHKYDEMRSYGYSHELAKIVMDCLNPILEYRLNFTQFLEIIKK